MARRKRFETILNVENFLHDAETMHGMSQKYAFSLRPGSEHGEAISRLSRAIRAAIEEVSGSPPRWTLQQPQSPALRSKHR